MLGIGGRRGFRATDTAIVLAKRPMAIDIKERVMNGLKHNYEVEPRSLKDGLVRGGDRGILDALDSFTSIALIGEKNWGKRLEPNEI